MEFYVYKVGDMYFKEHDFFNDEVVLCSSIDDAYIAEKPISEAAQLAELINSIGAKEFKLKEVENDV